MLLTRRAFLKTSSLAVCGFAGLFSVHTLSSCKGTAGVSQEETLEETVFLFDTLVSLQASCSQELMDQAVARCEYFDSIFSRTREGSDVWRINHAQGQAVEVERETAECIQASLEYSRISHGAFDITIGAVSELWDFTDGIKPDDDAIQAALSHINFEAIQVDETTVQLSDPEAKIDLGALAKGYICDDIAQLLRDGGCQSACINLGGNVYVLGSKTDGSPWTIGVQDPNGQEKKDLIARTEAEDISAVTSGLYERYFEEDGVRYYHILDPKTGYPVQTDVLSDSVLSERSLDADAFSTILFLLGSEEGMALLEERPELSGLIEKDDESIELSSNSPFTLV